MGRGLVNSRESVEGLGDALVRDFALYSLGDGEPLKVSDSLLT